MWLKIETIIIFSLEGAKTLFAMIEDPRVILSFNQAIYDPRQGQTGITTPRPSPIYWGDINFTLTRTIQNPSCHHARTVWTIYHLEQSYAWKRVKSYTTQGFGGRSRTRLEVMVLGDTPPVKPFIKISPQNPYHCLAKPPPTLLNRRPISTLRPR